MVFTALKIHIVSLTLANTQSTQSTVESGAQTGGELTHHYVCIKEERLDESR